MVAAKSMTVIKNKTGPRTSEAVALLSEAASWLCALALIALILVAGLRERPHVLSPLDGLDVFSDRVSGGQLLQGSRPCEEIYVVREGETLHTIGDKCGDPFIVERNPHIHDPDDVFPGLVIRINPASVSQN